jgi:hypothetical protein
MCLLSSFYKGKCAGVIFVKSFSKKKGAKLREGKVTSLIGLRTLRHYIGRFLDTNRVSFIKTLKTVKNIGPWFKLLLYCFDDCIDSKGVVSSLS